MLYSRASMMYNDKGRAHFFFIFCRDLTPGRSGDGLRMRRRIHDMLDDHKK
jgi:hypothetical protein